LCAGAAADDGARTALPHASALREDRVEQSLDVEDLGCVALSAILEGAAQAFACFGSEFCLSDLNAIRRDRHQ